MTASAPRLRLDRSKHFSTIHGNRPNGDPHQIAKFQQDGIHFDAQGLHIDALVPDDKRELLEKRLKRQIKAAPKKDSAGEGDVKDDPDDESGSSDDDVNLEAWLRGEAKYDWFAITKTMRDRYKKNLTKQVDVVEFLVRDQKIVTPDQLDPKLAALLPQD